MRILWNSLIIKTLGSQIALCNFLLEIVFVYCIKFNVWSMGDSENRISVKWNNEVINSYPFSLSNEVRFDYELQGPKLVVAG